MKNSLDLNPISKLALKRATFMFSCLPPVDRSDSEAFIMAAAQVLSQYPDEIINFVTDPFKGLLSTLKFPLTVAALKEACEARSELLRVSPYLRHRSEVVTKQLEERRADEERNSQRKADREFYGSGKLSDYLANGGPVPGPGRPHLGRGEASPVPDRKPVGNYPVPDKLKPVVWDDRLKGDLDRLLAVPSLQGR